MVLFYVPQYAPIELPLCPIHGAVVATGAPVQTPPNAPRILTLSLSSSPNSSPNLNISIPLEDTYPLQLLSGLTPTQRDSLGTIELMSPIHVHTPASHIGTIVSTETVNALDAFEHLRDEAMQPLDFHTTYSGLSRDMKEKVETAFVRRHRGSSNVAAAAVWKHFASGRPTHSPSTPKGYDLLLGNGEVWGFEGRSLGGYSVVHLDVS